MEILNNLTELTIKGSSITIINDNIEKISIDKSKLNRNILYLIYELENELKAYDYEQKN